MKIKQLRETVGLTQEQISQRLALSVRGYQLYESGKREPRASTAVKLAKILNTTVEQIWSN